MTPEEIKEMANQIHEENKLKMLEKDNKTVSDAVQQWIKDKETNPLAGRELTTYILPSSFIK